MYFPFMRGKHYELITIRETAKLMAKAQFVPVIAPVHEQMVGLRKALVAVRDAGGRAVVIVNPEYGQLANDGTPISNLLNQEFGENDNLYVGIRLHNDMSSDVAINMCKATNGKPIALVHDGFKGANDFSLAVSHFRSIRAHLFMDDNCGKLYRKKFNGKKIERVLIRDGFQRRPHSDHPDSEFFSDLHITYPEELMDGFGDFLIVGDEYSESGDPGYTVAIHLTCIDRSQDNAIFVRHFLSKGRDKTNDLSRKFAEALAKLIDFLGGSSGDKVYPTTAIEGFRGLHKDQHYPGLGYVKKLSMKHHIETLAMFAEANQRN